MSKLFENVSEEMNFQMIKTKNAFAAKMDDAKAALKSEAGAVDIVVILILIVLVVAIVVVFREQLLGEDGLVSRAFENIKNFFTNTEKE